jgi:aryl-alcohol dehydrogenase-like predicted oxidoreductase
MRLGFGCSGAWGMSWFDRALARRILLQALEAGVRHIDTAPFYADGEAERRLGAVLNEFGAPVFVSTKTGTSFRGGRARKDFSPAAIRADVEASLKRLGRERLDLLYLHGPSPGELGDAAPVLEKLEHEGKIARWGVCGEGRGLEEALEAGAGAIMGAYNILHTEHKTAFRQAKEKGALVVAVAPLAQGLYRRGFFRVGSPADAWRVVRALARNRRELARARRARPLLESVEGFSPAGAALAFALANPDIDCAVTTTTSLTRLEESLAAAGRPLPRAAFEKLEALTGGGAAPS